MKIITQLTCIIFTVLILTFLSLSYYDLAPAVTNMIAVQGFIMSVSISVLMTAADRKLKSSNFIVTVLTRIFICYFVVFLEGSLFKMIEFSFRGLMEITPALVPIFFVTYILQYYTSVAWANAINESIKHKK